MTDDEKQAKAMTDAPIMYQPYKVERIATDDPDIFYYGVNGTCFVHRERAESEAARLNEEHHAETIQSLRARIAELEAALRPFADALTIAAKHGEGDEPDSCTLYGQMTSDPLTFGDLRRAAQALEGDPND